MNSQALREQSIKKIISRLESRISNLNSRNEKFSVYRLIVFVSGVLLCIAGYLISKELGWVLTFFSLLGFGIVIHCHNRLLERMRRTYVYITIKKENLSRINIDWENIPDPPVNIPAEDMTIEKDLDLFGKHSLQNLIDVTISDEGSSLLRKWLTNFIPDEKKISENQKIIKELSGKTAFRDKFILKARLVSKKFLHCDAILSWIKESEKEVIPKWLFPVSLAFTALYLTLFILSFVEGMPSLWLPVFILYFFIYTSRQKKIGKIIGDSIQLEKQLKKFSSLIFYIDKHSFANSPALENFLRTLMNDQSNAAVDLKKLQKIISVLLIRENPIFKLILNILFPYDAFFTRKLLDVKSEIRINIPAWIKCLNELECYISLANFSYLNPDYVFPEMLSAGNKFETEKLGHPLLTRDRKVCNDFRFDKENEIVIITGSNMSGKSTFLRSLGINFSLAYSGAPVDAVRFTSSLFGIFTCIKVTDSVTDGISYFYAEVIRLKELLDEFENRNSLQKLFLIDEIFKGTNNRERLKGSRAYIKKLSELKGTGFISTHDLELVNLADEISSIENYHFTEEIQYGKMQFDYKIHKGPCPTTNALRIMEIAGLPVS